MASQCPTSASSMTSASKMVESMALGAKESMNSLTPFACSKATNDTNSPAGVSKAPQALHSTYPCSSSQVQLKRGLEPMPSEVSTTSSASISFKSDEEFFSSPVFENNGEHKRILESMRLGTEWQQDLERVHGFTEAESCECFSRAAKYIHCEEFPEDAVSEQLFPHAKEGWALLKEADRLARKYPQELMDLGRLATSQGKSLWDLID